MNKLRDRLAQFMIGRYGTDQLYNTSIAICFALIITNIFIRSNILVGIMYALLIISCFRVFSRNVYKRQMENAKFLKLWYPVKAKGALTVRRAKEFRTHRFRKCPHCKAVLRLPRKKGKHKVNCPRCQREFNVQVLL